MHTILVLIRKEFQQLFRDPAMSRIIFILPVLQLLLLGYVVTTDIKNLPLAVIDYDQSRSSRTLIGKIFAAGYFTESGEPRSPQDMMELIDHGEITAGLIVEQGFSRNLGRNESARVLLLMDGTDANSTRVAMGYLSAIVQDYSKQAMIEQLVLNPSSATAIITGAATELQSSGVLNPGISSDSPMDSEPHASLPKLGAEDSRFSPAYKAAGLSYTVFYNPDLESANYMIPGILSIIITILTSVLTSMAVVKEREIGTLEQIMVSPIKPYQLLLGKTIPFTILCFIVTGFDLAIGKWHFDFPIHGSLPLFFAFVLLFLLTSLGLGLLISTISRTQQQALFLTWFINIFAIIMSGFFVPIHNMPKTIQYLTYLNPVRYFMSIVRDLFLKGSGLDSLWPDAVILLAFGLSIFSLSVWRFRKRLA